MPFFRILLVEDFEPFRRFVRTMLEPRPEFKIVGEAVDGLQAIQKAKELQPDLILLDIGLPKLSGIAAAEQIRILAPDAKLLFISLESSSEIVQEAFRRGAHGYISKLYAHPELIPAIEAILARNQTWCTNLEVTSGTKARARHDVQFYSDEMAFLDSAARFVAGALRADGAAIVIATDCHRESLIQRLKADGFDMDGAIQQGTYISLNAAESLSKFMVDHLPDRARLLQTLSGFIESAAKATKTEHPRIVLFGEGVAVLWAKGDMDGAIQIEEMCNDLLDTHDIDILCAYPLAAFERADDEGALKSVCALHTAVFSR